jgi:hypothetical protein
MKRFVMLSIFTFLFGCSRQAQPKPGALCTVDDGEGFYRIAKVLVVDEGGVHVRLYKNKWKERPENVDASTLSLGGVDDKDGSGIGHLPLTKLVFAAMKPVVIGHEEVRKEELDGYDMWKGGGGGYFGNK